MAQGTLLNKEWIEELRGYFFSHRYRDLDIDAAMRLKSKNIPKSLYKYREINSYALNNLLSDTVWCANAEDFNDPYDSSLCFDLTGDFFDEKFFYHFNQHQIENGNSGISVNAIQKISASTDPLRTLIDVASAESGESISNDMAETLHRVLTDFTKKQMVEMNERFNEAIKKGYKVCSLSERVDSMLMWSHYARNHTGFVMEYDFNSLPLSDVRSRSLWPVIYDDKLFGVSKFMREQSESGAFNNLFGIIASIHKAKDWQYEQEWRLVIPLGPEEPPFNYSVPTPKAIYLGSKVGDEDMIKISNIASRKGIPVFKMKLAHDRFNMVPEPLESGAN